MQGEKIWLKFWYLGLSKNTLQGDSHLPCHGTKCPVAARQRWDTGEEKPSALCQNVIGIRKRAAQIHRFLTGSIHRPSNFQNSLLISIVMKRKYSHRATESMGLEGTFKALLVQPSCSEQKPLQLDQAFQWPQIYVSQRRCCITHNQIQHNWHCALVHGKWPWPQQEESSVHHRSHSCSLVIFP